MTYCKADETDKALGLWTILQEEGEIPSEQFLQQLGKHLKSKNRPVPFNIPDEFKSKPAKTTLKPQTPKKQQVEQKYTKPEVTANIENLVQEGKINKALDYSVKMIDEGTMPKANVLKYLVKKLAESGEVEKIQELGKRLSDVMRRNVTYDDKLTLAIFNRGAGPEHIDALYEAVTKAQTDDELVTALLKFPRSNALASVIQDDIFVDKCK